MAVRSALASGDLSPIHELTLRLAELHYSDLIVLADVQGAHCGVLQALVCVYCKPTPFRPKGSVLLEHNCDAFSANDSLT